MKKSLQRRTLEALISLERSRIEIYKLRTIRSISVLKMFSNNSRPRWSVFLHIIEKSQKRRNEKRSLKSTHVQSKISVAIENCLDSSALSLHDDIMCEEATKKAHEKKHGTQHPTMHCQASLSMVKASMWRFARIAKMRDFSNTAQWNNSTPVSVDASVTPELQR